MHGYQQIDFQAVKKVKIGNFEVISTIWESTQWQRVGASMIIVTYIQIINVFVFRSGLVHRLHFTQRNRHIYVFFSEVLLVIVYYTKECRGGSTPMARWERYIWHAQTRSNARNSIDFHPRLSLYTFLRTSYALLYF